MSTIDYQKIKEIELPEASRRFLEGGYRDEKFYLSNTQEDALVELGFIHKNSYCKQGYCPTEIGNIWLEFHLEDNKKAPQQLLSLQLTPAAIRCLKLADWGFGLRLSSAPSQYLAEYGLISKTTNSIMGKYYLTQDGRDWLEFYESRERKFWIPIVISAIALIVSIIALVAPS